MLSYSRKWEACRENQKREILLRKALGGSDSRVRKKKKYLEGGETWARYKGLRARSENIMIERPLQGGRQQEHKKAGLKNSKSRIGETNRGGFGKYGKNLRRGKLW